MIVPVEHPPTILNVRRVTQGHMLRRASKPFRSRVRGNPVLRHFVGSTQRGSCSNSHGSSRALAKPASAQLLRTHQPRLVSLAAIAIERGCSAAELAFIIAEGLFAETCLEAECGHEFLVVDAAATTVVIPADVAGLLVILADMISEGVEPVITRPVGTTPVLVVDGDDEPAVVFMETAGLARGASPRT